MEKKKKIVELRERLDRSLSSPELVNINSIKSLVKSQLLRSGLEGDIDLIVDKRANEVSNILEMLRSSSGNDDAVLQRHGTSSNDWKVKQDTDELRILYREGLHGSPFHTLLLEGSLNGPIDVCLCVSWEPTLYKKWWPQSNFPTFKVIASDVVKKVRIDEEIAFLRMKVPWPVSDREAILHLFEVEYPKEDLILILINTISEEEEVDIKTHGFTREGIPKADGTVRLDMAGVVVFQKINEEKSYLRAIYNIDVKLDFIPPSLINFVSRQLVSSGYKLFQKAVSTASSDEDYQHALKGPLYARVRHSMRKLAATEITLSNSKRHEDSPTIDGTSDTETEEEWYEAMDELPESSETNQQKMTVTNEASLNHDVGHALSILDGGIAKVCEDEYSGKNDAEKAIQRKFGRSSSNSKAGPVNGNEDLGMGPADMVGASLLNGCRYEGPSARDSRRIVAKHSALHRDNNGKVSDEGTLKKANGSNVKKRKGRKWMCCIGRAFASE